MKSNNPNEEDLFLCYDASIRKLLISKLNYNGAYFTKEGLRYKTSSITIMNESNLIGKPIHLINNINYVGTIAKLNDSINEVGVIWNCPSEIRKHGLHPYWTSVDEINIGEFIKS